MPIKTLQNPMVTPSPPRVLLLVGITAMVLQHTGATTSSIGTTSSISAGCVALAGDCRDEAACFECRYGYESEDGGEDAFDECLDTYDYDFDICVAAAARSCCEASLSSRDDCLENSLFMEAGQCLADELSIALGGEECPALAGMCSDGTSGAGAAEDDSSMVDDDGTTSVGAEGTSGVGSSPTSAMLTVAWLTFVTAAPILAVFL